MPGGGLGGRLVQLRLVEQRGQARQRARLGLAARAAGQVPAHLLHLVGLERAEDVRADEVRVAAAAAHGSISISSKISRRCRSAYEVRLLTVPSGTPVRSAISRMVSPP